MKIKTTQGIALATLLAASAQFVSAQTADLNLNSFDADAANTGVMWGSSAVTWDASQDATGNGGGALRIESIWSTASDTPLNVWVGLPGANPWWYGSGTINLSDYAAVEFDLRWDNSSSTTIDQWNNQASWPGGPSGGTGGFDVNALANSDGGRQFLVNTNIPELASNGWVRIVVPINPAQANIDPCVGVNIAKWMSGHGTITNPATNYFWIDNVTLKGTAAPPPPPTMALQKNATPGLNLIISGSGQYDRQSIRTLGTGYSFNGSPNPTTYSYTVTKYPGQENPGFQTHVFLIPNAPAANVNAPDWNEPNVIWMNLQNGEGEYTATFSYKTNFPNGNSMYFNTNSANGPVGRLGSVTSSNVAGTWGMTFNNNTSVTLFSPTSSTNITFPAESAEMFNAPLNVYFGSQANNVENLGLASVLSQVSIINPVGAADLIGNFPGTTSALDTNNWEISAASPSGIVVVPNNALYWVGWTLPDTGFSAQQGNTLTGSWMTSPGSPITVGGSKKLLVTQSSLPGVNQGYWRLVKREFSRLQILLPGETAAPGTVTGKTGTPIPQSNVATFFVTVRAVDKEWYPVSGVNHIVHFTSTDGFAFLPADGGLTNGEGIFEVLMGTFGSQTITVEDLTDPTKSPDTSSPVTIN